MTPNTVAIDSFALNLKSKMSAFGMYFSYTLANLCIKADPMLLLNIRIAYGTAIMKIEDVCYVKLVDDKHFEVIPKNDELIPDIIKGILLSHPELKIDKKEKESEEEPVILTVTVPEMTKSRRDVLKNGVDVEYNRTKGETEKCFAESMDEVTKLATKLKPEEFNYAKDKLKEVHDDSIKTLDQLRDEEVGYIEKTYKEYEAQKNVNSADSEGNNQSAGQKMKL